MEQGEPSSNRHQESSGVIMRNELFLLVNDT